jgi:hypothetical protein
MNVQEIVPNTSGSILHYFVTALAFTLLTVWVITAFQSRYKFRPGVNFWQRLGWPVFYFLRMFDMDPYAPTAIDSLQQDIDLMLIDRGLLHEPR